MNKYFATRTYSQLCDRTFDSKREATRAEELKMLEMAGEITNLEYQVKFTLSKQPRISTRIDFAYTEGGMRKYEDAKGVLTRDARTRYAWLKEKYNIEVMLV